MACKIGPAPSPLGASNPATLPAFRREIATSDNWSDSANWSGVPDLVFGSSNLRTTNVDDILSLTANSLQFTGVAPAFTIHVGSNSDLIFSGPGVTDNSTNQQTLINDSEGSTQFTHSSAVAGLTIRNSGGTDDGSSGGETFLFNTSTAGNAIITNDGAAGRRTSAGETLFYDTASAGSAIITNNGATSPNVGGGVAYFDGSSTAGDAMIINNGSYGHNTTGGFADFTGTSSAGNATSVNNGSAVNGGRGGTLLMSSNAGNVMIVNNGGIHGGLGGLTSFGGHADNATIYNEGGTFGGQGGQTLFFETDGEPPGLLLMTVGHLISTLPRSV